MRASGGQNDVVMVTHANVKADNRSLSPYYSKVQSSDACIYNSISNYHTLLITGVSPYRRQSH